MILHPEVQKNMQSAAIQKRLSEATIIEAKANVEAAKMLKETSEILNSNSAMQIRYLETIQNITAKSGSKVMFMNMKGKDWLHIIIENMNSSAEENKPQSEFADTASSCTPTNIQNSLPVSPSPLPRPSLRKNQSVHNL